MQKPKLSVIMSLYNEEKNVSKSIESILNQTFKDYELIIIDDASTDRTYEIVKNYCDNRIKLYKNKVNRGLTRNLNFGLSVSEGLYIARMDGDDISIPERFSKQIYYLDTNTNVELISCGLKFEGKRRGYYIPSADYEVIKVKLLFGSVLPHPGFMFRKELIHQYGITYNNNLKYAQDYDFQYLVSSKFVVSVIPEPLVIYRCSDKQISNSKSAEQALCANYTRRKQLAALGVKVNKNELVAFQLFAEGRYEKLSIMQLIQLNSLLDRLWHSIDRNASYSTKYFRKELGNRFSAIVKGGDPISKLIVTYSKIYNVIKR